MNKIFPIAVTLLLTGPAFAKKTVDQVENRFDESRALLSGSGRVTPAFDPLNAPAAASGYTFVLDGVEFVGAIFFAKYET